MELDEWKIGGRYNTMRLIKVSKDCTDIAVKIFHWLGNKGWKGGGV